MSKYDKAAELVRKIRTVFPEAIVAGGYLRDLAIGAKPKDIDVFIGNRMTLTTEAVERMLSTALDECVKVEFSLSYANMEVNRIFTVVAGDPLPVQIIELDIADPVERILQHDFGLCQIWHDGECVNVTGHFEWDVQWQCCSLVHCESEAEHKRSMRRWERLKDKLGPLGYTLRDATSFGLLGGSCRHCSEPFRLGHNVRTPAGERETHISGFCETCFDKVTADPRW
jgi:hypothetical protein